MSSGQATHAMRPPAEDGGDPARVATAFMLISMGVMVVTIAMALLLQSTAGYLLCAALYVAKASAERRFRITSPLSLTLFATYLGLAGVSLAGIDFEGYGGVVLFTILSLLVGGLLASGRPFSTFYSRGRGDPTIHRMVSVIWLVTYLTAIAATLYLIPNKVYLVVPPAICLAGGVATLIVNFGWGGLGAGRQRDFVVEELRFLELDQAHPMFDAFCRFYAAAIVTDPRQEPATKTAEEVAAIVRAGELALGRDSHIFIALQGRRIVGSIRCVVDRPGRPFPTEADVGFTLDPLRRYGRVMLVGRLAIAEDMRTRTTVITHLFASFVNLALERDAAYVLSDGFRHVIPTYTKVGFELLFPRSDRRHAARMAHGFVCYPVLLDFVEMILERARHDEVPHLDFYSVTNKVLAERYYKRALVRDWLARLAGRPRPRGIPAIRQLLADPLASGASGTVCEPQSHRSPTLTSEPR